MKGARGRAEERPSRDIVGASYNPMVLPFGYGATYPL